MLGRRGRPEDRRDHPALARAAARAPIGQGTCRPAQTVNRIALRSIRASFALTGGPMRNSASYDEDLHAWAMEQAGLLRAGRFAEADIEHIAEEIESLGKSEQRELANRLAVLLAHLLKWQIQPGFRSNSWRGTIREQRRKLAQHLDDNPSLRAKLDDAIGRAYLDAHAAAQLETGLPEATFPASCPFTANQLFDPDFLPSQD
jgi:hypothetical protein